MHKVSSALSASLLRIPALYFIYAAWAIALVSTLGSLGLSEIMHLQPCVLCWVQRICMYPLAVIVPIGVLRRDAGLAYYGLPLSVAGLGFAGYHTLLQWGILPEALAPCVNGVSCLTKQINWLGFITIPFMSFLGFAAITLCLGLSLPRVRQALIKH